MVAMVVPPKLSVILGFPTVFRDSQILSYILEMVERGDSKETIWDVYCMLSSWGEDKTESSSSSTTSYTNYIKNGGEENGREVH